MKRKCHKCGCLHDRPKNARGGDNHLCYGCFETYDGTCDWLFSENYRRKISDSEYTRQMKELMMEYAPKQ
jgi:hypothetical protein